MSPFLMAQEKARVAVIPFEAREVSDSEALVITELFETALVKTGVYNIIEQNDIRAITEAQAYSLFWRCAYRAFSDKWHI